MKVDCYVEQSSRAFRKKLRGIGYVLQCTINSVPFTITGMSAIDATEHAAELTAIVTALDRMTRPADITIHTADPYIRMTFNTISKLAEEGFTKANGSPMNNQALWIKFHEYSKLHNIDVITGSHEYSSWIRTEIERRGLGGKEQNDIQE